MADSLFNVHSLSDSASNIDTMEEDHGLMPRKDNYKNYKILREKETSTTRGQPVLSFIRDRNNLSSIAQPVLR